MLITLLILDGVVVEGNPFVELKASPLFQDLSLETIGKGNFILCSIA